jgi:orotate phosphoribosyltransferase
MLQAVAKKRPRADFSHKKERLLEIIKAKSLLRGQFKLASGAVSDYYLDMKPTTFDPEGSNLIADIVCDMLQSEEIDAVGGIELGAVPITIAVSMRSYGQHELPSFVVRKEKKGHGTDKNIDANFKPGDRVILFDDVTTKGGSILKAVEAVRAQGGFVNKVITIVDREDDARKNLAAVGIELIALFKASELLSR